MCVFKHSGIFKIPTPHYLLEQWRSMMMLKKKKGRKGGREERREGGTKGGRKGGRKGGEERRECKRE